MLKSFFKKFLSADESEKKSFSATIERNVNPTDIWEIISELGDGAFGKVYKTHKRNTELFAALKRVDFESEAELEDFMLEIDILTNFKHKNILTLHEVYIYESKLWIYLELCGGGALDSIMETLEKPLTEPQIRFVSREVLQGLEFLHEKLIIHRDMKAGNILLTLNNEVKLGITLIELAQKRPPHNATNPTRVLLRILKSDPPTLSRPQLWSSKFKAFLERTLQKDPNQRPECRDLLLDPFVSDVTENDRKVIQILLCEVNADIIETVEDFDPNEPIDEIDDNDLNPLILSDSTKLSIPVEIVYDGDDDDVDNDNNKNDAIDEENDNSKNKHESNKNLKQINDNSGDSGVSFEQTTSDNHYELTKQSDSANSNVNNRIRETIVHPKKQLTPSETIGHKSLVVNDGLKDPLSSLPSTTDFHDNNKSKMAVSPLKRQNSAYRTRTRTRRFVIDGQMITTTSKRIVNTNLEDKRFCEDEQIKRKAALRAFRILAKQEAHQTRELNERAQQQIDILENKMNTEFSTLTKTYDHKMEIVIRNYKLQMERLDKEFEVEMKRIRSETSKEERTFKDRLKSEIDTYDRAMRKAAKRDLNKFDQIQSSNYDIKSNSSLTSLKSNHSINNNNNNNNNHSLVSQRLTLFRENQESRMNSRIYDLHNEYNKRRNLIHSEYLNEIHTLRLNFEEDKWRTEHRFLSMKHQLDRNRQLDLFMIKREQLTGRSELELTELKQTINMERSKLQAIHSIERKNCIKSIKSLNKRSILTLQRQSRINTIQLNEAQKRMNEELELLELKHKTQTDELEQSIHFRLQELEQSTMEKRNALIDQETKRLQELDNRHQNEMRIYAESLPRIKALMKEQFAQEYKEDSFKINYNNYRSYSPKSHRHRLPIPISSLTNLRWGSLSYSNTKLNNILESRPNRLITLFSSDLNHNKINSSDSM
ncbi:unnamed protein product [Schistosoma margrebowiei]|uniref:Protein kinase domain-containing protein n=1 Tax=Schistosoma margrebowiei TaxID=48269 RepID=A0AA85AEJ0_9TREM|nr:unnamed protein product [Schistosoma margrebowiei]